MTPLKNAIIENITLEPVPHSAIVLDFQLNDAAQMPRPRKKIPKIIVNTITNVDFDLVLGGVEAAVVEDEAAVVEDEASAKLSYNFLAKRRSNIIYINTTFFIRNSHLHIVLFGTRVIVLHSVSEKRFFFFKSEGHAFLSFLKYFFVPH